MYMMTMLTSMLWQLQRQQIELGASDFIPKHNIHPLKSMEGKGASDFRQNFSVAPG